VIDDETYHYALRRTLPAAVVDISPLFPFPPSYIPDNSSSAGEGVASKRQTITWHLRLFLTPPLDIRRFCLPRFNSQRRYARQNVPLFPMANLTQAGTLRLHSHTGISAGHTNAFNREHNADNIAISTDKLQQQNPPLPQLTDIQPMSA
jgi:hypothetical protein